MMKILASAILAAMIAGSASAACIAEYKAKRDDPLRLFYGTLEIGSPCTIEAATAKLSAKLAAQGMTLLKVLSVTQE